MTRVRQIRPDGWTQVAIVLICVQTLWRGWAAYDAYFWQDDFRYLADMQHGLSADMLFQSYNGHVMPGSFLMSWVVAATGSSHVLAASIVVFMSLVAAALLAITLRLLFGAHIATLVVLAAALFTPLTLVGYTWFAYGLQLWPQQISLLAALCSYAMWRRSGRTLWCVMGAVALLFGLFFWEKALLVGPAVVLFALLAASGGPIERLRAVIAQWRWFAAPVVLSVAYLALYLVLTNDSKVSADLADQSAGVTDAVQHSVLRLFLPGLLGGPWTATGAVTTLNANPSNIALAVSAVIWVGIIGCSFLQRGRSAGAAWIWLAVVLTIALAMVAAFRGFGGLTVRDSRYLADLVPMAAVAVAWAYLPLRLGGQPRSEAPLVEAADDATPVGAVTPAWQAPLVLVLLAGIVASSWVTVATTTDRLDNRYSRNYVNGLRTSLAAETEPLLVTPAPPVAVMLGSTQDVAEAMGIKARWVRSGANLRMVDPIGQLRPVGVPTGPWVAKGDRPDCGWLLTPQQPVTVQIPAVGTPVSVRVGLMSGQPQPVTVEVDGAPAASTTTTVNGLGVVVLASPAPTRVTVRLPQGTSACVTDVSAGVVAAQE